MKLMLIKSGYLYLILTLYLSSSLFAQQEKVNYDENAVKAYVLPDPLLCNNGQKVKTEKIWWNVRRKEILEMFETKMFGKTPIFNIQVRHEINSVENNAFNGKATRKQVSIFFSNGKYSTSMQLLIYLPNQIKKPVPVFLGLNFNGNQSVSSDTSIEITKSWVDNDNKLLIYNNTANENSRGIESKRWSLDLILERGYGVATIYYGDLDPDFNDGFRNGIHPLFYKEGQAAPASDEWGAIGAWAWGLMKAMDYLQTDTDIDARKVALIGHSRLGKAALWAGAQDQRFSLVISNNSGCGGAALSKRNFGETVGIINSTFPHWFCGNFKKYNYNESSLPFDQHMLLALIAPRPLYVASASEDRWADPKGEFLGAFHASPVYKLLGSEGLTDNNIPDINIPVMKRIGYHIRSGYHDVTQFDWKCYLDFADKHFQSK